jgi:hypothetical protein
MSVRVNALLPCCQGKVAFRKPLPRLDHGPLTVGVHSVDGLIRG